jgi:hypothetical protein
MERMISASYFFMTTVVLALSFLFFFLFSTLIFLLHARPQVVTGHITNQPQEYYKKTKKRVSQYDLFLFKNGVVFVCPHCTSGRLLHHPIVSGTWYASAVD